MFGLDPFNPAVAVAEMVMLLAFAAFVGWLLGRLVLSGRLGTLQVAIGRKEAELNECRQSKSAGALVMASAPGSSGASTAYDAPRQEPVAQMPDYVPADPLLPAINQDDTPALVNLDPPSSMAGTEVPVREVPGESTRGTEMPAVRPLVPVNTISVEPTVAVLPTGNSEAAVLNRIAARASELNFDRIGVATAAEADDLKDIVGVGPFLERKLHSLGIYTFRQVANFTREDVAKVNDIIEFFPGRIERDNWVDQSRAFYERKYGQPK